VLTRASSPLPCRACDCHPSHPSSPLPCPAAAPAGRSQRAAIKSLALYAHIADALVIVAPTAPDLFASGQSVGAHTYNQRAWCRAEQVRDRQSASPSIPLA
jgi:hypothetical protein